MLCFYYWVLEPPSSRITDRDERAPVFEVTIKSEERDYKVALFLAETGRPEFVRMTIPGLEGERVPDDMEPFIRSIGEHMLTTLRLGYDESARFFPFNLWNFKADGKTSTTDVAIQLNVPRTLNADLLQNLFTNSLNHREEFRLFNNGTNEGIPPQYRFLSLYKLLEMKFKKQGEWVDEVSNFVAGFKTQFEEKGLHQNPVPMIHRLRDKCAHVRTGRKREVLGVSELNHKELVIVLKVLPIMAEMGAQILGDLTENRIAIRPADKDALWEKQALYSRRPRENNTP